MEDAIRVELCQIGNHRRIRQDENPSNIGNGKNGKEDPHEIKAGRSKGDGFDVEFIDLDGDRFLDQIHREDETMFLRLSFNEKSFNPTERSIDDPDPHPFLQIGGRGGRYPILHQSLNGGNLLVRNGCRFSIVSKNPDYTIRFQYLEMCRSIQECPNKEIPWKKRKVNSLSTILSPTPPFNQRKKGFNVFLGKAFVYFLFMS
jgi:hypothetical protein